MGEVPLYLNQVEASPADPRVFIFIRHDMYVHAMELQRPAIALSNSWDDRSNPPLQPRFACPNTLAPENAK